MIDTKKKRKAEGVDIYADADHVKGVRGSSMATDIECRLFPRLTGVALKVYHDVPASNFPTIYTTRVGQVLSFSVLRLFLYPRSLKVSSSSSIKVI